jgi:ribosomal protein L37AE/L43A
MPPNLDRFASHVCPNCTHRGQWARRGKYIVCRDCGSEFLEMPGNELAMVGRMQMKTEADLNRAGSGRRLLRTGKP